MKHFRLVTLGRLALLIVDGEASRPVAVRPRHLAVLAVLALSPRAIRRDALAELFWGDEPEVNARHSLSNALSALRSVLGAESISSYREEVALAPSVRLTVDAAEFELVCDTACDAGDHARAAVLYRGSFLDDTPAAGARTFEDWVDRHRARFERHFVAACEGAGPELLRTGEWEEAASIADRWLRAAPRSTAALRTLIRAREGSGSPSQLHAALAEFDRVRRWLNDEYAIEPDESVNAEVENLVERLRLAERKASAVAGDAVVDVAASSNAQSNAQSNARSNAPSIETPRKRRRRLTVAAAAAAGVAIGLVASVAWRAHARTVVTNSRSALAITDVENVHGDTSLTWLQDGIAQLVTEDLARADVVDPVAPSRVREVLARRGLSSASHLSVDDAVDVARRVGARWEASGGIAVSGGVYVLELTVRDVSTRRALRTFSVSSPDPVQLGHLAAMRLLDAASVAAPGNGPPRFTDAATTSAEAYRQYVLGARDFDEGRYPAAAREWDVAISLDSGFVAALQSRRILARNQSEYSLEQRLDSLLERHRDRMSEWDKLSDEAERAMLAGEVKRSEALAARLVARFLRDPRAYAQESDVLTAHGRWLAADSVRQRQLALDSLAMAAGDGPCAPCGAYSGLVNVRLARGDMNGAERAARQWLALQPTVPGAWAMLAEVLESAGHIDEALDAERRVLLLSNDWQYLMPMGRTLLAGARYRELDSVVAELRKRHETAAREGAADLSMMLARERGQFRRAATIFDQSSGLDGLMLVQADNLVRSGKLAAARRLYEQSGHDAGRTAAVDAQTARAFTWAHALEADAIWRSDGAEDSVALRTLADSLAWAAPHSYYGRDWALPHHVAALLALSHGDSAAAERELIASRFVTGGWTRTDLELAKVQLARGRSADAIATLRDAQGAPLDAMGRYVPKTEISYWMARAFARVGERDSATVYANRVRTAWIEADPEVRPMLETLPH